MRLVDFSPHNAPDTAHFGLLTRDDIVMEVISGGALQSWLELGMPHADHLRDLAAGTADSSIYRHHRLADVRLLAPIRAPRTLRDFYAFEQHVQAGNAIRGRSIPPQWYEIPVFYFSNPTSILGPDEPVRAPRASNALDFELEVACVIGKGGRDIRAEDAEAHIAGYLIFNDWSARDIQRQEVAVGLGPAKGKDFASSLGPMLVTPDELADRRTDRAGVYNLSMVARVNGVERSRGNWADLYHSFGDMVARASADATLYAGDVIGSGTVGTGCLLELTRGEGPWLQSGDVVELEIERLGVLRNQVY